ncbi:MAG: peptidoglycan DD-metalloendopeptidase family protein [Trueperaceae bacterium]|nr:MAG: peptidoglycan DD-metalloendopeptidase family protein [Trueperaceae bacterium]
MACRKRLGSVLAAIILAVTCTAFADKTHTVAKGDTLFALASRFDTTVEQIKTVNELRSDVIQVGQVLKVPGVLERVGYTRHPAVPGETLASLASRYEVSVQALLSANPALVEGWPLADVTVLIPPGEGISVRLSGEVSLLSLALTYRIAPAELVAVNGLANLSNTEPGQLIFIPQAEELSASVARPNFDAPRDLHGRLQQQALHRSSILLASFEPSAETFVYPLTGRLSSGFGWRNISVGGNRYHAGIDLAAPHGSIIRAARDGVVVRAAWVGAYGYAVFLEHGDGSQTRYAHMSRIDVTLGEALRQGDPIGLVGSTGASTGPHLHFELRFDGRAVDPLPYLN